MTLDHMTTGATVTADIWNSQVDAINSNASAVSAEASARTSADNLKADKATKINPGTGLTGGGDLSTDRTLTVKFGTGAGTVTQGNDSRVSNGQTAYTTTTNSTTGNSALGSRLTTVENEIGSGVGTSTDGSTSNGTVGAQLQYIRNNSGGGGTGGSNGPWVDCVTQGLWSNRSGYPKISARILADGNVQLVGTIIRSTSQGPANAESLFSLPQAAMFPPGDILIYAVDNSGLITAANIKTDGKVYTYFTANQPTRVYNFNAIYAPDSPSLAA